MVAGGWSAIDPTGEDVLRIVRFVVGLLNSARGAASDYLLGEVIRAEHQVVSGSNYRVTFGIRAEDAPTRLVTATVWEQPWLDHLELTELVDS